jgi:DNA-binding GntR family transcriptional regulator
VTPDLPAAVLPAAQRAYVATKDLILTGALPAGSLLSEGDIAGQLELSRTPVREAFLRLEGEELLRLIPKRGAVVVAVPPTEAADVLDVRLDLETGAVRRLVERDTDLTDLLARLKELIARQFEFATAREVAPFAEVDELFHRSIVNAARNTIADRFYASLADRQRRMAIGSVGPRPERLTVLVKEHRGLMDRVRSRDLSGFETALRRHLDSTHNAFHSR